MNEVIDFDISQVSKALNDLISKFKKIAETKDDAFDDSEIVKLSKQVNDLTKELSELEKKRNSSFDVNEIKKFNAEIEKLNKNIKETKMPEAKSGGLASFSNILKGGAIAGVAMQVFELGKAFLELTDEVNKSRNQMAQFSKLSGSALEETTAQARSLAKTFGKDFNEVLKASNALSKTMGISFNESLALIEKGFIKGADANGDFLDSVAEYSVQFKNAGYSAEEFIKITTQGVQGGVFSDKLPDAIKELGLSLAELPKASQDALKNAFGADFTNKLVRDLDKGTITTRQGLKLIQEEAKKTGLSVGQMQTLVTDVFKGAGEDVGSLTDIFKQLDEAEKINLDNLSESEKATKKSMQANKEYEAALVDLSKQFEGWGNGISTFFTQLSTKIINSLVTWKKAFSGNSAEDFKQGLQDTSKNIDNFTTKQVQDEIARLEKVQENYSKTLQNIATGATRLSPEANAKLKAEIENNSTLIEQNLKALYDKQLAQRHEFYNKDKNIVVSGEKETNAELLAAQTKAQEERTKARLAAKQEEYDRLQRLTNFLEERNRENEIQNVVTTTEALKTALLSRNLSAVELAYQNSKSESEAAALADEEKVNAQNEFYARVLEIKHESQRQAAALDIAILEGAAQFATSLTAIFGESVGQFGQLFQDVSAIFSAYQKVQDVQRAKDSIEAASNLSVGVTKAAKLGFPQAIPAIFSLLATVAAAFGTVKRIAKFNEGTRHVQGGGNTDTVPALLTAGEAVITQSENKKLKPVFSALDNGMITHNQLVNFATGKLKSGVVEKNVISQTPTKIDEKALQNAFENAIKKLPINKFSFDENGFNRSVQNGLSEISFLNKTFK